MFNKCLTLLFTLFSAFVCNFSYSQQTKTEVDIEKGVLKLEDILYNYEIKEYPSGEFGSVGDLSFDITTNTDVDNVFIGFSDPYKKHPNCGSDSIWYRFMFPRGPLTKGDRLHLKFNNIEDGIHLIAYYKIENNSICICDSTTRLYVNDLIDEKDLLLLNAGVEDIDVAQTVDIKIRDGAIVISNADKTDIDAVALYNLQGMEVHRSNPKQPDTEIPTSMLKHGIYVLRVTTAKTTITKKVKLR